jgi:hypothetical protein
MRRNRIVYLGAVLALAVVGGCSPSVTVPGQFQLTKPRMDREREVGAPSVQGQPRESDTVQGGPGRKEEVKVRHGDDQPEHR